MWKRPSTYVTGVAVIAAVATALLPYWAAAAQVLKLDQPDQLQRVIFTLIGVHVALLIATLTFRLAEHRYEFHAAINRIEEAVKGPKARRLRDADFYAEFLQAAYRAQSSVCICYFGPRPPDLVPDKRRRAYYRAMGKLMVKRGDQVRFRRLLRRSPENERWAALEIRKLRGTPKVDFALLSDLDPADPNNVMPLALSVQIVDQERVWLVAVQSHEQIGEFRDLVIEGGEVAPVFQLYFDRLWKHGDVILENGTLTASGRALFERLGL